MKKNILFQLLIVAIITMITTMIGGCVSNDTTDPDDESVVDGGTMPPTTDDTPPDEDVCAKFAQQAGPHLWTCLDRTNLSVDCTLQLFRRASDNECLVKCEDAYHKVLCTAPSMEKITSGAFQCAGVDPYADAACSRRQ